MPFVRLRGRLAGLRRCGTLVLLVLMMPNGAAGCSTQNAMVTGHVAGNTANRRT